jgi:polysaccharide export outer membrane protein
MISSRLRTVLLVSLLPGLANVARAQFTGPAFESASPPNRVLATTTDPAVLNPPDRDIRLDPGDTITVKLFGVTEFAPPVRVALDGTVQLPLLGILSIGGLTIHHAEDLIAQRLVQGGMYRDPQVTVQLTDYSNKFATITGEVHAIVPILGERRLYDVLSAAGGSGNGIPTGNIGGTGTVTTAALPITASRIVTILRPGLDKPIVVDLGTDPTKAAEANIPILAHDTIVIAHVGVVYIVGAFKIQGAIPLDQSAPLTLLQATALSGGAGYEAKLNDLRILRVQGDRRITVPIDAGNIFKNRAPDPVLQAGDIVFLPTNSIKAALKANGLATLSSLGSLLIVGLSYR